MADQKYLSDEEAGFGKKPGGDGQKYLSDAEVGFSQPEESNLARGFKTAMRQVPQTFGGAAALVGDAVGSKGLRDWGLDVYKGQEDKIRELSRDSDSFTNVLKGDANLSDWAGYGAGYVGGQALQSLATGGVGGFIGKKAAEIGARKLVEEGVKRGAEEAAKQQAKQQVRKGIERGAGAGLFGSNLMQEAGSIYPEAVEQAREDGRLQEDGGLSGGDLARVGGSAVGAAALDTLMEAKIAKGIMGGGASADPSLVKRVLKEGAKGAGREALTEGAQTGIERWGAQQSLGDKEAIQDYIDSAALGALGGGLGGAPAGLHTPRQARGFKPEGEPAIDDAGAPGAAESDLSAGGGFADQLARDSQNAPAPSLDPAALAANGVTLPTPAPVLDTARLDAEVAKPTPSEAMGLRHGPDALVLENAAALAVDSGASPVANAAAMAESDGVLPEAAAQDATTASDNADLSAWADADLSTAFQNAQQKEIRQQLAQELQRRREVREQQALQQELAAEQSVPDMPNAPDNAFASVREDAGEPETVSQPPKEASRGTQAQETQQAGQGRPQARAAQAGAAAGAAVIQPEVTDGRVAPEQVSDKAKWIKALVDKSRLNGSSGAQIAATPQGGITFLGDPQRTKNGQALLATYDEARKAGATDQEIAAALAGRQKPVVAEVGAQGDTLEAMRQQLRDVEDKIIEAASAAMGQGGGDIEAAMKSRKVPVTLKARRTKLKEQIAQAQQFNAAPSPESAVASGDVPPQSSAATLAGDAKSASQSVDEIAATIHASINDRANKKTRAYYDKEVARGVMTAERAEAEVARGLRRDGEPGERTRDLAQAIADKDPRPLVNAWAMDGKSLVGSEGSAAAFEKMTGVKLARLNATDRAQAIFGWAGWTKQQADEYLGQRRERKQQAMQEREAEDQRKRDNGAVLSAERQNIQLGKNGEVVSIRTYVDGLIAQGFDALRTIKRGAVMRHVLANKDGRGHILQSGPVLDYARGALSRKQAAIEDAANPAQQAVHQDSGKSQEVATAVAVEGDTQSSHKESVAALLKEFNSTPEYLPLEGASVQMAQTDTLGVKGAGWYVVRDGQKISPQFSTKQQATAYMGGMQGEPNPEHERLHREIAAAAKQATQKTAAPTDFIPAPDDGLDYGEITPEMGKQMRRQAGKIRLRRGDETWGLTHIEQRHAKDFAALGFKNAQDFVATVASGFGKIYQGRGAALDMVLESDKAHGMLIVSLELSPDGDFYDIKTATPIRRDQFKNEEPLWERAGPSAPVVKDNPSYPRGQSGDASVPVSAQQGKTQPLTPDTAADLQAGDIVVDANGKEYRAHAARHKWLEAHPIENGKANVSADTLVTFHLDPQTASGYPERSHKAVFLKEEAAENNPLADYNALAQEYGFEVRPDGAIGSDGKFPGPKMKVKGGRLRIESGSGDLLASYASPAPQSLGKFLESFWYAQKKAPVDGAGKTAEPASDRDHFTLERLNRETDAMEPVTFERGEYVRYRVGSEDHFGEIDGISHARGEFSVDGLWYAFGFANKAERPATPARSGVAPLSSVIDKMNAKHGAGLTDADRVPPTSLVDAHEATMQAVREGKATPEQFKASFEAVLAKADAIRAELSAKTKAQLLAFGGPQVQWRHANSTKPDIVDAVYHEMLRDYALGETITHGLARDSYQNAVRRMVEATDADKLAQFVKERETELQEVKARGEARAQALESPQSLNDYRQFVAHHMQTHGETRMQAFMRLTPEQRVRYDALEAEGTKAQREQAKATAKTAVAAAGQAVAGEVIATKHTKLGHDLFVVQLAERVSREDYETLNASARRMGGSYSSYRGGGAVPGFQFRTREAAEAFQKLVGGDTQDAKAVADARRDAFEDDRSQSGVQRLRAMAQALDERADASLGQERKANTARRARFAASAEAAARADKALAATMRNLAAAIEAGKAKFLDAVRQKVQVQALGQYLRSAKDAQVRAKYANYGDQQEHLRDPVDAETVDHAEFPSYTAMRSDLASVARQMLEVDGLKKLGARLEKVADEVTAAYTEWARQNLTAVSQFARGDQLADFASREDAERALRRSGMTGRAIVLPVKRGHNRIVLAPGEAMRLGLWTGDGDKRITLSSDFGRELVEALGRRAGGAIKLPWTLESALEKRKRLESMGIFTAAEFRSALREFADVEQGVAMPDKIKELERSMVGRRADGLDFFPTSAAVVDDMLAAAEIEPGMAVLEPSAGMGHIADAIRDDAGVTPDVVELSGERRELLEAKGHRLVGEDFMAMQRGEGYDRIIMNPPFSKGRDIEHVRHAYSLLKPGGRVVAIMGEGAFFQSNKNAEGFRQWLDELGASSERLPEGSFTDPSLPVNTGANARMVVIDKPAVGLPANDGVRTANSAIRAVGDAAPAEASRVQAAIEGKGLIDAARFLTQSSNQAHAEVAQKVLEKLLRLEDAGVELKLNIVHRGEMAPAAMANSRGYTETGFDSRGRDIVVWLNGADVTGKVGVEEEVLLHELVHAATAGMVFYGTSNPNSLAGKHVRDLSAVTDAIAAHITRRFKDADAGNTTLTEFERDMRAGANNAFRNDDEVLAWALSNAEAQQYLEGIPYKSESLWSAFVGAVRRLLGLQAQNDTALSEVLRVADRLMTDDAPDAGRAAFWHKRGLPMVTQQGRGSLVFHGAPTRTEAGDDGLAGSEETDAANFEGRAQHRPGTAQDKAVIQAMADGKSARDILRLIASQSRQPFNRQVARLLLKAGITPNVVFGHIGKSRGNPIHGQYKGSNDTLYMAGSAEFAAERIFLHEAMHAATLRALKRKGLHSIQLRRLYEHVKGQRGVAGFYGIKNIDEFVAEVFTNPDFQNALRGINAPSGSVLKTAWDSFVRILRSILGLSNDANSALAQALEIGVAVMREDMALRKKGVAGSGTAAMMASSRDSGDTESQRQFRETERAYGGRDGYQKAKDAGKTKLTYGQWVQVRTPNFIRWFGDHVIASAVPQRQASNFDQAREQAKAFQGKPLTNPASGIVATVSRNNLDKMLSEKAVDKSAAPALHSVAVANLDGLFERAILGWSKPDANGDPNIRAIHRFFAPLMVDGQARLVKMTVKETGIGSDPNPLYTVEAVEFNEKSPAAKWVAASLAADGLELTSIRSAGDVQSLAQRVQDFNPDAVSKVVDTETGEPLVGRELAVAMYERGASSAAVAKAMGNVSVATVKRWVSDAGAQRTASEARGGTKENRAEAVRLYSEGLGAFEIAKRLGVSNRGVYIWLRDAGVEIRSMSEAQSLRAAQGRQPIRGVRSTVATKWGDVRADSVYEAARLRQLEADPEVENVARATESIKWGKNQRYTPDFVVTMKDGGVRVEEVKPTFQQDRDDVVAKAEAAREALGGNVDYQMVVTEDLTSGFIALRDMRGLSFASDADQGRFKRALATVKSAIGNRGTFDPQDPDIRHFGVDDITRNVGEGIKGITATNIKKAGKHKLTDWLNLGLQFLGRRQLVEVYGKLLPMAEYDRLAAQMEADKNDVGANADDLARRWGKLADEGKLADLMHDATLAQIDADESVEPAAEDDRMKAGLLKARFKTLTPEAKRVYREARDSYKHHHEQVRQAIRDRIQRSALSESKRAELLRKMDDDFFQSIKGVYFPLARFGQYVVAVKDKGGSIASVSRAETMSEAEAMRAEMRKAFPANQGFDVGRVTLSKDFVANHQMVGRGFMADLYAALDKADVPHDQLLELEDTIGQLYLSSLPDLSWAKHGIHRKGTPGFSQDARRAYAQNTFHGARYLAKLRYGDLMQDELDGMQKHVDDWSPVEDFDQPKAQRVVNEMMKRHDALMNPKGNPLSTAMTSAGFVYYLGLSPAAAVVNLSQTALVAYPIMGAKWGYAKAADALLKASRETVMGKNDLRSQLKDAQEIAAYDEAVRSGAIDVTQSHDLAGIAQGEDAKVMWKIRPVMRAASFLFHHAERFNRQATFIAAYRLAKEAGAKHEDAYAQAVKATYDGHFDYGACVDDSTEILTTVGWKRRADLRVGDIAIATDKAGRAVESKVQAINVYEGQKEVVEFQGGRRFNMVLTPNHDAVVQTYSSRDKKWQAPRKVRADELKQHHFLLRAPLAPVERVGTGIGDDLAALLGWIAAEGWYAKYRKCKSATDVRLGQSVTHNPEYVTEIRELLGRLGGEYKEYTYERKQDTLTTFVLRRSLGRRVQEHLPEKVLTPQLVQSMSTSEMRAFILAFLKGDGSQHIEGKRSWMVGQKGGANLDLLQAMATMCGMRASVTPMNKNGMAYLYVVTDDDGYRSHVRPLKQTRKIVPLVWCPTTEHGTWIARRNGAVFVTGNSNRPRVMQGNVARVVLLFKQFGQNMIFTMARNAYQSVAGESPAVRKEARKVFAGLVTTHAMAAGVLGLPLVGPLLALASALGGDDDDPWDAEVALRNMFADVFGNKAAEVMAKGVSRLTPWDISGRVGLDDLIFPDVQEGLEGKRWAESFATGMLGPVIGMGVSAASGAQKMADGDYERGLENFLPLFARNPIKALRFMTEGAKDRTGISIKDEVGAAGSLGQLVGFSPSEVRLAFEGKKAVMDEDRKLNERRAQLSGQFAKAAMKQDQAGMDEARQAIAKFNEKNPGRRITAPQLWQSVRARQRRINEAEEGVYLPRKRRDVMQAGAFALNE